MNRILVTGHGLGLELGTCAAANFDFGWILNYPSVLLWADKILVSRGIWDSVIAGAPAAYSSKPMAQCFQLLFRLMDEAHLVEVFEPDHFISPSLAEQLFDQVEQDLQILAQVFPDRFQFEDELRIDGTHYCFPYLTSVYAALILARTFDASCLFDPYALHYCRYKFGLNTFSESRVNTLESFRRIFNAYLPNQPILPSYVCCDPSQCSICKHENDCAQNYLQTFERDVRELLVWRTYDEIQQFRQTIDETVGRYQKAGANALPDQVLHDFQAKERALRRLMKSVFPKVRRWANLATMISIPVGVAGAATGVPLFTLTGATVAALAQVTKHSLEYWTARHSWVGFVNQDVDLFAAEGRND